MVDLVPPLTALGAGPWPADSAVVQRVQASPNRRPRNAAEQVRFVVVHGTWMTSDADAIARLTHPSAEVSAHYYISRDGTVTQLVPEQDVAWHAGRSRWTAEGATYDGLNGTSIGIEVGNAGPFHGQVPTPEQEAHIAPEMWAAAEPYTEAEYLALERLLKDILQRHRLGAAAVLGHDEVAPGRKTDPGAHFDWARLARAGVALERPLRPVRDE